MRQLRHFGIWIDKFGRNYTTEELMNMTDEELAPPPIGREQIRKRLRQVRGSTKPIPLSPRNYNDIMKWRREEKLRANIIKANNPVSCNTCGQIMEVNTYRDISTYGKTPKQLLREHNQKYHSK